MSRIRTIKPELFRHEDLFEAEIASGLPLRLAFIGLLTVADCEGRFIWKPRTLKLDVMPHDTVDFAAVLNALKGAGFIQQYEVAGKLYGLIPTFTKHQQIPSREAERGSSLPPPPPTEPVHVEARTEHEPVHVEARTEHEPVHVEARTSSCSELQEGKGREEEGKGKGREREDARTRKTPPAPMAPDWQPSPQALDILSQQGIPADFAQACIPEFRLYWTERGEQRPGWDASFVNSVKRSWEKRPLPRASPQSKAEQLHEHNQRAIAQWLAQNVPVIEGEVCHVAH